MEQFPSYILLLADEVIKHLPPGGIFVVHDVSRDLSIDHLKDTYVEEITRLINRKRFLTSAEVH